MARPGVPLGAIRLGVGSAGVAAVLHAIQRVAVGELAVVQAVIEGGEFIVWVDFRERGVIAAFASAPVLLAGLQVSS